jgi:ABC-type transport system involved in multi-copper enzyme maturation permease subunit
MLARVQGEVPARYADQGGRRRLVVAGAVALALLWVSAAVSWALAPSATAMVTSFAILAVVGLAGAWIWSTLSLSTRGTVGLPGHLLDERQAKERLHAHANAHRLTLVLLFVTYFAVGLALPDDEQHVGIPSAALTLLFAALMATVAALPSLVVAWRMPDPPADDD